MKGDIEATFKEISQEVKAWSQMGLPNGQWPQPYNQIYDNSVFRGGHYRNPDVSPVGALTQLLQLELADILGNYC